MANVDVDFFKTMTPELAYVLGLWASDGCIFKGHKNRSNPSLTCHLGMNDEEVIRWVAETIEFKNKVLTKPNGKNKIYVIEFVNKEVVEIFESYNINYNKSLTMTFPDNIPSEFVPHYVRGVFDGDGSIYSWGQGRWRATFTTGSGRFAESLQNKIFEHSGIKPGIYPYKNKNNPNTYYKVAILAKQKIIDFAEWLYQDAPFALERKRKKFRLLGANV